MSIEVVDPKHIAIHAVYLAAFNHRDSFSDGELVRLMTVALAHESWSWRVVGITPAALKQLQEQGFRYRAGSGITRAHQTPRLEMTRHIFNRESPMTVEELIGYWRETDKTVICARGENSDQFDADVITIDNPEGRLFTTQTVNFRLRAPERSILEAMALRLGLVAKDGGELA